MYLRYYSYQRCPPVLLPETGQLPNKVGPESYLPLKEVAGLCA